MKSIVALALTNFAANAQQEFVAAAGTARDLQSCCNAGTCICEQEFTPEPEPCITYTVPVKVLKPVPRTEYEDRSHIITKRVMRPTVVQVDKVDVTFGNLAVPVDRWTTKLTPQTRTRWVPSRVPVAAPECHCFKAKCACKGQAGCGCCAPACGCAPTEEWKTVMVQQQYKVMVPQKVKVPTNVNTKVPNTTRRKVNVTVMEPHIVHEEITNQVPVHYPDWEVAYVDEERTWCPGDAVLPAGPVLPVATQLDFSLPGDLPDRDQMVEHAPSASWKEYTGAWNSVPALQRGVAGGHAAPVKP